VTHQRTIDTVDDFFRIVSGWCNNFKVLGELHEHFLFPDRHEDDYFGFSGVVSGLAHAAKRSRLGISVDHNEGFLVPGLVTEMIEVRVGRPGEFWSKPELYTDFVWDGPLVEDGLRAFDRWLAEENLDLRGTPLRLLNVFTKSDFYLSYLCPEEQIGEAASLLETLDVAGSVFEL